MPDDDVSQKYMTRWEYEQRPSGCALPGQFWMGPLKAGRQKKVECLYNRLQNHDTIGISPPFERHGGQESK